MTDDQKLCTGTRQVWQSVARPKRARHPDWQIRATGLLKEELKRRDLGYKELAEKLKKNRRKRE